MRCARSEKVAKLWVESYRHGEAYLQVADGGAGAGAGHNAVFPGADLRGAVFAGRAAVVYFDFFTLPICRCFAYS